MQARRLSLALSVSAAIVLALAIAGDAQQSLVIDESPAPATYEPILQPPRAAFDIALEAIRRYGGLPRDAQLRGVTADRASDATPGSTRPSIVTRYSFSWQPRDETTWHDHVIVSVGTRIEPHCADAGSMPEQPGQFQPSTCRSYIVRYALQPVWVRRVWHPWPLRRITSALTRWSARLAPMPSSFTTACKHIDVLALRRVVGNAGDPIITLGSNRNRPTWTQLTKDFGDSQSVTAHWSPPYPTMTTIRRAPVEYRDAFVSGEGALAIRFAHPSSERGRYLPEWFSFESTVQDAVCPPRHLREPSVSTRGELPWRTVLAILQARAEHEAVDRTKSVRGLASRLTSVDERDPKRSLVTIETRLPHEGTWLATYTVDRNTPAILEARYQRAPTSP
jgi:hypothetical protein